MLSFCYLCLSPFSWIWRRSLLLLISLTMMGQTVISASAAEGSRQPSLTALSLQQALELSRSNLNLDIAAAQIQVQAALAEQAGRWPNPHLMASVEEYPSLTGQSGEFNLQWQQDMPLAGRIQKQVLLAEQETRLAQLALDLQLLALQRDLTQAYYQALTWQALLRQAEVMLLRAQEARQLLEIQYQAGKVLLSDLNRSRLLEQDFYLQSQTTRLQFEQAKTRLVGFWNQSQASELALSERLILEKPLSEIATEKPSWENHPEAGQASQELRRQQLNLDLQAAQALPDLSWSLGLRYSPYQNNGGPLVGLNWPLPINNSNQGAIDAAQIQVQQTKLKQQSAQIRFHNRQQQALLAYQQTQAALARYQEQILPVAEENIRLNHIAFEAGKLPYLAVLDAQKSLNRLRFDYLHLWGDYHQQRAELAYFSQSTQLLGSP